MLHTSGSHADTMRNLIWATAGSGGVIVMVYISAHPLYRADLDGPQSKLILIQMKVFCGLMKVFCGLTELRKICNHPDLRGGLPEPEQ